MNVMDMILGLTPTDSLQSNALIELALEVSQLIDLPTEYQLRKNGTFSWPHLSLFQFDLSKETYAYKTKLEEFWSNIVSLWQNLNRQISLNSYKFLSVNPYIEYKEKNLDSLKTVTWAQLQLNLSLHSKLKTLHQNILNISNLFPFQNAMSEFGNHYDAHITLFNTLNQVDSMTRSVSKFNMKYRTILCHPFEVQLVLGSGNSFGELTAIYFASNRIPF